MVTTYVYDGIQVVGEMSGGNRTTVLTGWGVDELIAHYSASRNRTGLTDGLGSVLSHLRPDATTETAVSYSVYGESARIGPAPLGASGYTGREDDGTGLVFYRARFYDSALKRFTNEDPIALAGGLNQYAYVGGDPANQVDPSGNCPWCIGGAIGFGFDLVSQLIENGGNLQCIDPWRLAASTALGAVGGGLGGRGLTGGLRGLSNGTKGQIGETLSVMNNTLRGSVQTGARNSQTIPGQTTFVDSTWRSFTGATYYVESKFGTSGLTAAQRRAAAAMGDAYRVERWGYPFFERVGAGVGGAAGGAAGRAAGSDCGCR